LSPARRGKCGESTLRGLEDETKNRHSRDPRTGREEERRETPAEIVRAARKQPEPIRGAACVAEAQAANHGDRNRESCQVSPVLVEEGLHGHEVCTKSPRLASR
jgi:hypothetical protein